MDAPAAGWYPFDEHSFRFWDGAAWTDRWAPRQLPAAVPAQAAAPSSAPGHPAWQSSPGMVALVIVMFAIVGLLFLTFFGILGYAALGGFSQHLILQGPQQR
jgi:hypothetical protein